MPRRARVKEAGTTEGGKQAAQWGREKGGLIVGRTCFRGGDSSEGRTITRMWWRGRLWGSVSGGRYAPGFLSACSKFPLWSWKFFSSYLLTSPKPSTPVRPGGASRAVGLGSSGPGHGGGGSGSPGPRGWACLGGGHQGREKRAPSPPPSLASGRAQALPSRVGREEWGPDAGRQKSQEENGAGTHLTGCCWTGRPQVRLCFSPKKFDKHWITSLFPSFTGKKAESTEEMLMKETGWYYEDT